MYENLCQTLFSTLVVERVRYLYGVLTPVVRGIHRLKKARQFSNGGTMTYVVPILKVMDLCSHRRGVKLL